MNAWLLIFIRIIIFVILYTTNIMSNVLTTFPYTNAIVNKTVPFFPGAYISRGALGGANGIIPIYTSIPNFTSNGMTDLLNDKDAQVLVLPGFSLELYPNTFYGSTVSRIDNSGGTDMLYRNASLTASSCKLFYKFPNGTSNELTNGSIINVTVTTSPSITPTTVVYNSISYNLYSFTTVGASTFSVTSATDVSALVLLVAGGGSGGAPLGTYESAGGGGAGGVAIGTINIPKNAQHTCTVGNGGQTQAANGGNSTLTNNVNSQRVTVIGGGGGGGGGGIAKSGGSGGGVTSLNSWGFSFGTPQTDAGNNIAGITNYYGNSGGTGWGTAGAHLGGGGGGGAGGGGATAHGAYTEKGGNGGAGYTWPVNGVTYAGGGGGGSGVYAGQYVATGGSGGGGNGSTNGWTAAATSGAANRGGGGGGGYSYSSNWAGGGSGIIIVAIPQLAFLAA